MPGVRAASRTNFPLQKSVQTCLTFYGMRVVSPTNRSGRPMSDDCTLRAKAREALQSGKLPTRKPDRTLGGLGRGGACALCGELLTPTGMEIEIEFDGNGTTPRLDTYLLHPRCFAAWESLCTAEAAAD